MKKRTFLLALLFLPLPTLASIPHVSYPVEGNETMATIAKQFGLPLSALREANEVPTHTILPEGTIIRIPSVYRTAEPPTDDAFAMFSVYKKETTSSKADSGKASLTTIAIEKMRAKYRRIVETTVKSSSSITEEILYAVMWTESGGKSSAVSNKGAQGVMQINAVTQRELGLKPGEAFVPKKAIPKAAEYLEENYETFGDWKSAILAYGIGPANAKSYLKKRKNPAHHPYVKKVLRAQALM